MLTLISPSVQAQVALQAVRSTATVDPVIPWNRNLVAIVRTPGAQPATIHSTRSFAIMHAAIYDAVNAINGNYHSYLIEISGISPDTSQDAAAATAAHDVLIGLYPSFQTMLDAELQQSLAQVPDGPNKELGVALGQLVADEMLALRSNDGSDVQPPPFVFGSAPGNYQSNHLTSLNRNSQDGRT